MIHTPFSRGDHERGALPSADAVLVGIPFDLGAPHRGAALAPTAIRQAGLQDRLNHKGCALRDLGDLLVPTAPSPGSSKLNNLPAVLGATQAAFYAARSATRQGETAVFLGGDHSVAIGTIAGVVSNFADRSEQVGLIWFDAHGDFNTPETTMSGNIHGMPFATTLGFGAPDLVNFGGFFPKVRPENAVLIGARDLDPGERELLEAAGIRVFAMQDVAKHGIHEVMQEAIAIATKGTKGVHVSFDLDVVDPQEAPGTGYRVPSGMSVRDARAALKLIGNCGSFCSLDLVELDPTLDIEEQSAQVAVELIGATFER